MSDRESIIKEFEKKMWAEFREAHPETVGEKDSHFDLDNFKDWLISKVIAQGEEIERLKPEKGGLRPDEYMHEWMEQDAVGFDLPPEEIIEHLCRDNRLIQEKYDMLKQRIDDAKAMIADELSCDNSRCSRWDDSMMFRCASIDEEYHTRCERKTVRVNLVSESNEHEG